MAGWYLGLGLAALVLVPITGSLETALRRVNRGRIRQLAEEKNGPERRLDAILEERPRLLAAVVSMRSIVLVLLGFFIGAWSSIEFHASPWTVVGVGILGLTGMLVLELAILRIAAARADQILLVAMPLLRALRRFSTISDAFLWLARPLARMAVTHEEELKAAEGPTKEDIGLMVEEGKDIPETEKEMIQSIFELRETMVREVMVPRVDMICVEVNTPLSRVLDIAVAHGHSRLPVYEGTIDNIVGIVYTRDLLNLLRERQMDRPLRAVVRPPYLVPGTKKVDELLRDMQRDKVQIAIVVDEYGGTDGLVSMEDLIEEIVGEITDEHDKEMPGTEFLEDGSVVVDAKMVIEDVNDLLGVDIPVDEYETIGGFAYGLLGKVPNPGDAAELDGLEITAEHVHRQRITKVRIKKKNQVGTEIEPKKQETA